MAVENCHPDAVDMRDTWASTWMDERMARIRSLRARLLKALDSVAAEILELMDAGVAVSMSAANLRDMIGKKVMIAIRNLLQRPWWCRTWIYQELLLSKLPILYAAHKDTPVHTSPRD